jgi:2-keto-4-pentenoate hydratase/2-oxohepta-3-ene-1,7-dioic acid hydratase in catechol pathway
MNYQEHCDELKIPHPVHPIVFNKFASTIIGPFDNITKPT